MMALRELMATFPTEDDCKRFLQERRWPDGVYCPRCGKSETVYALKTHPWKWECSNKECRKGHAYRFSIISRTIFENTKYPLKTWFEVLWQMLNSKKGVSALQIQRQIGCSSYQTAWYMCHRLRAAMYDDDFKQLMGVVEVDETYIGGKQENRHRKDRQKYHGGGAAHRQNHGHRRDLAQGQRNLQDHRKHFAAHDAAICAQDGFGKVDLVATDTAANLQMLRLEYPHKTIDHKAGEYVRGEIHINNIESFWALLKRGVIGTYHNVSKKLSAAVLGGVLISPQ